MNRDLEAPAPQAGDFEAGDEVWVLPSKPLQALASGVVARTPDITYQNSGVVVVRISHTGAEHVVPAYLLRRKT